MTKPGSVPEFQAKPAIGLVSRDGEKRMEIENTCQTCHGVRPVDVVTGCCRDCWRIVALMPWVTNHGKP